MNNTELYSKYCKINDAIFELNLSIGDLRERDQMQLRSSNLSDIEDAVAERLKDIEDAEE